MFLKDMIRMIIVQFNEKAELSCSILNVIINQLNYPCHDSQGQTITKIGKLFVKIEIQLYVSCCA